MMLTSEELNLFVSRSGVGTTVRAESRYYYETKIIWHNGFLRQKSDGQIKGEIDKTIDIFKKRYREVMELNKEMIR